MKALLLVGGFATRLRPLSLNKPKCLFPLNNEPIIDYLLRNLANADCNEIVLAVNNLAEKIRQHLGDEKYGITLHYSYEEKPLGTGGPIKQAEDLLEDDDFLVLNGDILSFIDYRELMSAHRKSKSIASLTLTKVEDPSRYGVVRFGDEDHILEFVEKPSIEKAPSNWINAGCYALSPEILKRIPSGRKTSIEREVFPSLAVEGGLRGFRYFGDWIDIGVPRDYLKANKMLQKGPPDGGSVSPTVKTGRGSRIIDSIIWEGTCIGSDVNIRNSIIATNCVIGDNILLDSVIVPDNTVVKNSEDPAIIRDVL